MPTPNILPPGSTGGLMPPMPPGHHGGGPPHHHMMMGGPPQMHDRDGQPPPPQTMMGGQPPQGPPMMPHQGGQMCPPQQQMMPIGPGGPPTHHHPHGPPQHPGPGGPPMPPHHPGGGGPPPPMPGHPGLHHPHMHPPNPSPMPIRMQPFINQLELRIFEMNKRLQQRNDFDSVWWDMFASDFFDDDATLTIIMMDDGPKRYSIGRILIPRFFRSFFESGCIELYYVLRNTREVVHPPFVTLDSDNAMWVMNMNRPPGSWVIVEGRLTLDFSLEDMRMRSWMFQYRMHREMISRSLLNCQDMALMDQLSKNITRCGLTMHTLNFLRMCVILEPMQELMSRQKAYALSPRDCLKTTLFQKWQRMLAPQGQPVGKAVTENPRPQPKRRKRKGSGNETPTSSGRSSKRKQSPGPIPGTNMAQPGEVMIVGEPTLMGGDFGDEDERRITRLENTQFDPSNCMPGGGPPHSGMMMQAGPPGPHPNGPPHMPPGPPHMMHPHGGGPPPQMMQPHPGMPPHMGPGGPPPQMMMHRGGGGMPPGMMMPDGSHMPPGFMMGQQQPPLPQQQQQLPPGPPMHHPQFPPSGGRPPSASNNQPPPPGAFGGPQQQPPHAPPQQMMMQQSPHHNNPPHFSSGPSTPSHMQSQQGGPMPPGGFPGMGPGHDPGGPMFSPTGGQPPHQQPIPPRSSSAGTPKALQHGGGMPGHLSNNSSPLMHSAGSNNNLAGNMTRSNQGTPPPPMLSALQFQGMGQHPPVSSSSPLLMSGGGPASNKSLPSPSPSLVQQQQQQQQHQQQSSAPGSTPNLSCGNNDNNSDLGMKLEETSGNNDNPMDVEVKPILGPEFNKQRDTPNSWRSKEATNNENNNAAETENEPLPDLKPESIQ